jgi:hypothetical protein
MPRSVKFWLLCLAFAEKGGEGKIGLKKRIQFYFFVPTFKLNVLSFKL